MLLITYSLLIISITVSLVTFPNVFAQNKSVDFKALVNKGITLGSFGNHAVALQYFDKALAIQPNNFDILYNKANVLAKLGSSISPSSPGSMTPPSGLPLESIPGLLPITTNNTQ